MNTLYNLPADGDRPAIVGVQIQDARAQTPGGPLDFTQDPLDHGWVVYAPSIDDLRAAKVRAIGAQLDARIAAGFATQGEVVALDDASQTRFTAMGATALGVIGGALPSWPTEYAQGWIAVSNDRIPLPTAQDGLALASAAGAYTGALIQHARDLKTAALTAADPSIIDEAAGWPANGG